MDYSGSSDSAPVAVTTTRVPSLVCPSEVQAHLDANGTHFPLTYAVCGGTWFILDPVTGRGGGEAIGDY